MAITSRLLDGGAIEEVVGLEGTVRKWRLLISRNFSCLGLEGDVSCYSG